MWPLRLEHGVVGATVGGDASLLTLICLPSRRRMSLPALYDQAGWTTRLTSESPVKAREELRVTPTKEL